MGTFTNSEDPDEMPHLKRLQNCEIFTPKMGFLRKFNGL